MKLQYLHTMIRVGDLDKSIRFYCDGLGFHLVSRKDYPKDKFTLAFLQSAADEGANPHVPQLELTYNWGKTGYERGDAYGHMAFRVDSIDEIQERLKKNGFDLSWGPGMTPSGTTRMAFVDDPDGYEIELLEEKK